MHSFHGKRRGNGTPYWSQHHSWIYNDRNSATRQRVHKRSHCRIGVWSQQQRVLLWLRERIVLYWDQLRDL